MCVDGRIRRWSNESLDVREQPVVALHHSSLPVGLLVLSTASWNHRIVADFVYLFDAGSSFDTQSFILPRGQTRRKTRRVGHMVAIHSALRASWQWQRSTWKAAV